MQIRFHEASVGSRASFTDMIQKLIDRHTLRDFVSATRKEVSHSAPGEGRCNRRASGRTTGYFKSQVKSILKSGNSGDVQEAGGVARLRRTKRSPCSARVSTELASGSTNQYSRTLKCSYRFRFSSRSRAEVPGDRISITKSGGPWTFLSVILADPPWRTTNRSG